MTSKRKSATVMAVHRGRAHPSEAAPGKRRDRALVQTDEGQTRITVALDSVHPFDTLIIQPREGFSGKFEPVSDTELFRS